MALEYGCHISQRSHSPCWMNSTARTRIPPRTHFPQGDHRREGHALQVTRRPDIQAVERLPRKKGHRVVPSVRRAQHCPARRSRQAEAHTVPGGVSVLVDTRRVMWGSRKPRTGGRSGTPGDSGRARGWPGVGPGLGLSPPPEAGRRLWCLSGWLIEIDIRLIAPFAPSFFATSRVAYPSMLRLFSVIPLARSNFVSLALHSINRQPTYQNHRPQHEFC
jgi:hypothetical protein